ncbi:MAG: winged helix-turn-helix transcriptional regulator [Thermofilaceae archaeon]
MRPLAVTVALAVVAAALAPPPQPLVVVTLYQGGLARIDYFVPTGGNVSIAVPLIGDPDEQLGVVVVDEWGEALAYGVNRTLNALFVACLDCMLVKASYYTQTLTSKQGAVWTLNLTAPYRVRVVLPENATVVGMSRLPDTVYSSAERLVLEFGAGPLTLQYIILYTAPPQPAAPQPAAPTTGTQPPEEKTAPQQPPAQVQQPPAEPSWYRLLKPPFIYALAAAVALVAAAAVFALRRRGSAMELVELSEEDTAILNALRSLGGGAFQSELQKVLSMPSTTLWRRVKRLEQLGYVKVEKRAGRNYIKLA